MSSSLSFKYMMIFFSFKGKKAHLIRGEFGEVPPRKNEFGEIRLLASHFEIRELANYSSLLYHHE